MKDNTNKVRITEKHTGKMDGMQSLSTPCTVNPRCIERMTNGKGICIECYADAMLHQYSNLEKKLHNNARILATRVMTSEEIAALNINCAYFRFEAFGDVINETHAHNYRNIAASIPATRCALWSKNMDIVEAVMERYGKPQNLRIILSIETVNPSEDEVMDALAKYPHVDAVFCVYTKEYAEAHAIDINCGARHCLSCHLCYDGDARIIREILKPKHKKAAK